MKHPEDLEGLTSGRIDDEVRKHFIEQNRSAREISATVTAAWSLSKFIEALEQLGDDTVRCIQALFLQQVKPNGIYIEDGIFRELKRIQEISPGFAGDLFS